MHCAPACKFLFCSRGGTESTPGINKPVAANRAYIIGSRLRRQKRFTGSAVGFPIGRHTNSAAGVFQVLLTEGRNDFFLVFHFDFSFFGRVHLLICSTRGSVHLQVHIFPQSSQSQGTYLSGVGRTEPEFSGDFRMLQTKIVVQNHHFPLHRSQFFQRLGQRLQHIIHFPYLG